LSEKACFDERVMQNVQLILQSLDEWRGTADKERYIVQLFACKLHAASRELYVVQLLVSSSLRFPLIE